MTLPEKISLFIMPGMDGLGLIRRVRHLYPSVECAILSGYGEFEYAQTAMSLGVSRYLLKPVKQAELFMLMDELNRKATQHHLEKSVATAGSVPALSQTQESKDQVNIAMVVCCGNFPIHAVHNPDRVDFWERVNLAELLSSVAPQAQHWVMAGKTPVERNIALSLRDCSPKQGLECARKIYGTLCHIGGPITVGVKVDFGSLYSLGSQVLKLRNLLAERAIPGVSQIIDVDIPVPNDLNFDFSLWRENLFVLFHQKKLRCSTLPSKKPLRK